MVQLTSFLQDKQLTIAMNGEIDHHGAKSALLNIADKINQFMPMLCVLDFKGGFLFSLTFSLIS